MKLITRLLTLIILSCAMLCTVAFASADETYTDGNSIITVAPNNTFVLLTVQENEESKSLITIKGHFDNLGKAYITGFFEGDKEITESITEDKQSEAAALAESLYPSSSKTDISLPSEGWVIHQQDKDLNTPGSVLPDKAAARFNEAIQQDKNIDLTPLAYLACHISSGTNYLVLCKGSLNNIENSAPGLFVVNVYADSSNNANITQISDFNLDYYETLSVKEADAHFSEEWLLPEVSDEPNIPEDALAAFNNTIINPKGVSYKPVVLLASKNTAGTEYAFLCHSVPENADIAPYLSIIFIKSEADGQLDIINILPLNLTDFNYKKLALLLRSTSFFFIECTFI